MLTRQKAAAFAALSLSAFGHFAIAAVTAEQAARLKSELTPFGAEKAGNRDGTIPAWSGGYTTVWPGYRSGQPRPDPFAGEKPVLSVTRENAAQYAEKIPEGEMAMLQRFPGYRLDVYPTHRTATAPQWVYDNTYRNATRATTSEHGLVVENVHGGVPFPIPADAYEAMWNHLLVWKGISVEYQFTTTTMVGGKPVLTSTSLIDSQYPYYYPDGAPERGEIYSLVKSTAVAPPSSVGQINILINPVNLYNENRRVWQYVVGQRRVRRLPTLSYEVPNPAEAGFSYFDEASIFNGPLDRYEWKLLGKKEMFVPYNAQRFQSVRFEQLLGPQHVNPEHVRWELHRVWVVEATLAPGKNHPLPRRRFYLDEDTWLALMADGWDGAGRLVHTSFALPMLVPELPAVVVLTTFQYDFQKQGYIVAYRLSDGGLHYQVLPRRPEKIFSPEALASEGVR